MMKILFPIRIKSSLLLYTKKYVFHKLLNNLRNICFISHLINANEMQYIADIFVYHTCFPYSLPA